MATGREAREERGEATPAKQLPARMLATLAAFALFGAACAEPPDPSRAWPEGNLLIARTTALRSLLESLTGLEGTRIARHSTRLLEALPDCAWVEAKSAVDDGELWSTLACHDRSGDLAGLDRIRGEADIAFALESTGRDRSVGTLTLANDGDLSAEILLPESSFESARTLLLPGRAAPGPALLNRRDELIHARLRPEGGIDIASLVPESSQADRMFRLKSELFAGAVLDGTWEVAVYLPEPGRPMPRAALAVGFEFRDPAVRAMEAFLTELRSTWPVRRSDFALGAARGACLLELKLMPDFAPCYVATDSALVIGWNAASVRKALEAESHAGTTDDTPQTAHALTVELARIPEADSHFASLEAEDATQLASFAWPWRRLTADGEREPGGVRLRIRLAGDSGA